MFLACCIQFSRAFHEMGSLMFLISPKAVQLLRKAIHSFHGLINFILGLFTLVLGSSAQSLMLKRWSSDSALEIMLCAFLPQDHLEVQSKLVMAPS